MLEFNVMWSIAYTLKFQILVTALIFFKVLSVL